MKSYHVKRMSVKKGVLSEDVFIEIEAHEYVSGPSSGRKRTTIQVTLTGSIFKSVMSLIYNEIKLKIAKYIAVI